MKIVTIVGTRPQFIKGAVVSRAIARHNQLLKASPHIAGNSTSIKELIIHTGQHFDYKMSDIFFDEMEIPWPHCDLGIHKLSHGAMTGRMIEAIEALLKNEKPHLAMVYGDSNSTLAGALAAVKLHIPVAHVEAGLRSFNRAMPEEQNRIMTDHVSTYLFCPTQTAVDNLKREGLGNHPVGADSRRCPEFSSPET